MYTLVIMSNATVLNIKIDKTLKQQAQELAKSIGLPMSTVIATGLKEFVRTQSITLSAAPRFSPDVEEELDKRLKDIAEGKNLSPTFTNIEDARSWLES